MIEEEHQALDALRVIAHGVGDPWRREAEGDVELFVYGVAFLDSRVHDWLARRYARGGTGPLADLLDAAYERVVRSWSRPDQAGRLLDRIGAGAPGTLTGLLTLQCARDLEARARDKAYTRRLRAAGATRASRHLSGGVAGPGLIEELRWVDRAMDVALQVLAQFHPKIQADKTAIALYTALRRRVEGRSWAEMAATYGTPPAVKDLAETSCRYLMRAADALDAPENGCPRDADRAFICRELVVCLTGRC